MDDKGSQNLVQEKKLLYKESLKANATDQDRLKYTQYRNQLILLKEILNKTITRLE